MECNYDTLQFLVVVQSFNGATIEKWKLGWGWVGVREGKPHRSRQQKEQIQISIVGAFITTLLPISIELKKNKYKGQLSIAWYIVLLACLANRTFVNK